MTTGIRYVIAVDITGDNLMRICYAIHDCLLEVLAVYGIRHRDTARDDRDIGSFIDPIAEPKKARCESYGSSYKYCTIQ